MRNMATDIVSVILIVFGLILPYMEWLRLTFCKYILHISVEGQYLHSQSLKLRIALLEQNYPQNNYYIIMLRKQLQMYLNNPSLDRETEMQMIRRIIKENKEE